MSNSALSEKAILVRLNLTAWSAKKYDKRVTADTNAAHNAAADAGRYNKNLLPREALAAIAKIDGEVRTHFALVTSPWLDIEGTRIMRAAVADKEMSWFQSKRQERELLVDNFCAAYPTLVANAPNDLNGMYNPADYPSTAAIRGKFRFRVDIDPMPDSRDFRIDIGESKLADIRREHDERAAEVSATIVRDCYSRIAARVGRMVDRLQSYRPGTADERAQGTFHDSLVENIRELIDLIPSLDVTGDSQLAATTARLESLVQESADNLRNSQPVRESVAAEAVNIMETVNAYLA